MTSSEHCYSREEIALHLDEALAEVEREPATDLRASFWDRLTEGGERACFACHRPARVLYGSPGVCGRCHPAIAERKDCRS